MMAAPSRRHALAALSLGGFLCATAAGRAAVAAGTDRAAAGLRALETGSGGRLGLHAVDTATGASLRYRAGAPFPMCSTHKFLVGAAILTAVEQGRLRLDRPVRYGPADLLDHAPVTRRNVAAGVMTVEALCEAAIRWSDNTADNLLLALIGGPAGWTRYARALGDGVSRLDRIEPALNSAVPGDPRDTSTPAAMSRLLAATLLGNGLGDASRARLKAWMLDSAITERLMRAGLPSGWHVADKSGSGANGTRNDVGLLYPPQGGPIILSLFLTGATLSPEARDHVIARCTTLAVDALDPLAADPAGRRR